MRRRGGRPHRDDGASYDLDAAFAEYAARFGPADDAATSDAPPYGDRWSTWDQSQPLQRGPTPHPDWVITDLGAVDTELGILKTGKEADVFLLERAVPDTDRAVLLAAKRYRDSRHRMFHRDAGYLEGRTVRESRVNRAIAKRTAFGREAISGTWAAAEFDALCRMWRAGIAVPYPVQIVGTELLMEFVGDPDGTAAPRLAQLRPTGDALRDLWQQLRHGLALLARDGYAHGDLSAYNLLVHSDRLVFIDVPQIVEVIGHPRGRELLERDVRNVGRWFTARGLPDGEVDALAADLVADAGLAG